MSKTTKIIVITLVAVVILSILGVGACVGLGILWFTANEEDIRSTGEQAIADGEAFGTTHNLDECVDEALDRVDRCGAFGLMCEGMAGIFMTSCLENSEPQPEFCQGVPSEHNILESAQWSLELCAEKGQPGSQPCTRAVQNIQRYCGEQRPSRTPIPQGTPERPENHQHEGSPTTEADPSNILN